MWQIIAIIITGILAVTFIAYRIYQLIKNTKQKNNPCLGCTGCDLSDQIKSKEDCPEGNK